MFECVQIASLCVVTVLVENVDFRLKMSVVCVNIF